MSDQHSTGQPELPGVALDDDADNAVHAPEFEFETVGERLAAARKRAGLSLEDVSARTKVRRHHLQAIEQGDYTELPGRPYVIGFAKVFARTVGLDENEIADAVRTDLDQGQSVFGRRSRPTDIVEPSKIPSARLAWLAAIIGLALLVGGFGIWRSYFFPAADVEQLAEAAGGADSLAPPQRATSPRQTPKTETSAVGTPTVSADDPVVFTAKEAGVWVKFYDAQGQQLFQKQMALGEQFVIPGDADKPQIWTGRPDAFAITIGGQPVPPLGETERTIKDVPVSAAALLARPAAPEPIPASTRAPTTPPSAPNG